MRLFRALWTLVVMVVMEVTVVTVALAAADPLCDPETQYLLHGECCEMCRPGTSMTSSGNCRNPECTACEENEYTDKYNKEQVCKMQPYCDPNQNFEFGSFSSKTKRRTCLCKAGFHCSSATCLICAAHTQCELGSGAKTIGGQTRDTECEKCPEGTFSDQTSWNATCECAPGYEPQEGSSESNRVCVPKRGHVGLIWALTVPMALVAIAAAAILFVRFKRQTGHKQLNIGNANDAQNVYTDDYRLTVEEEQQEKPPLIVVPPTDEEHEDWASVRSRPEESEYCPVLTQNRDVLSQDSKTHVISQAESNERSTMAFN